MDQVEASKDPQAQNEKVQVKWVFTKASIEEETKDDNQAPYEPDDDVTAQESKVPQETPAQIRTRLLLG